MDNITHTLVGLAAAELIHRSLPIENSDADQSIRRRLILVACAVASNFPDLDLVLTPLMPPPLGYLLHHRGHTHTLLYAIPQALLMLVVMALVWRNAFDLAKRSRLAKRGLAVATLLGFGLHMAMDYLNSYGIHPFHPFDSRWFYGDMVFIIEPLFWVAAGAPLVMMIEKKKIQVPCAALLIGLPTLFSLQGFLAWYSTLAIALTIATLVYLQSRDGTKGIRALVTGAMIMIVFVGLQSFMSGLAKKSLQDDLVRSGDGYTLHDVAATPLPTNPFCWTFVSVESNEQSGLYRLRRGLVSVVDFVQTNACPMSVFREEPASPATSGLSVTETAHGALAEIRKYAADDCHLNAWFRFARAPFLQDGRALDLRFASKARVNFTVLDLKDFTGKECPTDVPQWTPPRRDLLAYPKQ